jgi:hypothetical protein
MLMRKLLVAGFAAAAVSLTAMPSASADTAPQSCSGQFISTAVTGPLGPGRQSVAQFFFGDQPHAVQDAEFFLQNNICP